ncbi:MAG: 30S ribosomal protein S17 [Candidatus Sungbacteria bacterium RIFCSPLOWO2_01_FULL_47_10]|uniref:Small ribosomal subunit protein uS17 n=1 Tax=Candidatus Sungbacteria bacterium RIFCSPLOWO2_01_FULL_47_10 TaxID=1802276 RepID=A0A1G2L5N3_9BACT|nr:MAG: 30S ribosomal protein S17 [Candidatus Sungbacteria bacterium RIFCSPLOWO2_01_FULL_47_10]
MSDIMRKLKGTIVSDKMMKTVVVRVDSLKLHPKYRKYYRVSEKYKAHDEKSEYKTGDVVMIQEMRPMSKDKRWRVVELVKRQVAEEAVESDEGSGINE